MTRPRLTAERRRALELLVSNRHGINEELLILGHGFRRSMLVSLVRSGLAATDHEVMKAGGKTVGVVSLRITAAGLKAIEGE